MESLNTKGSLDISREAFDQKGDRWDLLKGGYEKRVQEIEELKNKFGTLFDTDYDPREIKEVMEKIVDKQKVLAEYEKETGEEAGSLKSDLKSMEDQVYEEAKMEDEYREERRLLKFRLKKMHSSWKNGIHSWSWEEMTELVEELIKLDDDWKKKSLEEKEEQSQK